MNGKNIGAKALNPLAQTIQARDSISAISQPTTAFDAAVSSGQAFLSSELDYHDPIIRRPLTSFTYFNDVPVEVGGGWADQYTAVYTDYGVTNGSGAGLVHSNNATNIPYVHFNRGKDVYPAHKVAVGFETGWFDLRQADYISLNIERELQDAVRYTYDYHMDELSYIGFEEYDGYGLVNNPDVTPTNVAAGAAGSTQWSTKTPQEILLDVNTAINSVWENSAHDLRALPNRILLPYEAMNHLGTIMSTELSNISILEYLKRYNVSTIRGVELTFGSTKYLEGVGVGGTNRMVVYNKNPRFLKLQELAPLQRMNGVTWSPERVAYITLYGGNMTNLMIFAPTTIGYFDGI